jgi:outer membrane protein W
MMMVAALGAATMVGTEARAADGAKASGIEIGLRTGYKLAMGDVNGAGTQTVGNLTVNVPEVKLSDSISGGVPLWLDLGYRINPNIFVGGFIEYAFLFVASQNTQTGGGCPNGASCSAHSITFGLQGHYHFLPDGPFDPWAGIGFGAESVSASASANNQSTDSGLSGLQFVFFQLGGDYKVMPNFGVGPFAAFSLGQYSSESTGSGGQSASIDIKNTALHEWLTIGVRGAYDINL